MTFKQALKEEKKITAKRFGMLKESGIGVWFYECKSIKVNGSIGHKCRYRGCYWKNYAGYKKPDKSVCDGKKWEGFWLASELTRTDWKTTIVSEDVLDAILINSNE